MSSRNLLNPTYLVYFRQPRCSVKLGLEEHSQSLFQIDGPHGLSSRNFSLTDLAMTVAHLDDNGLFEDQLDGRFDRGHLRQDQLAPVSSVQTIHRVQSSLEALIDTSITRILQGNLQLVLGQDIDKDGGFKANARIMGGKLRQTGHKATTVLKSILFANLPTQFILAAGNSTSLYER